MFTTSVVFSQRCVFIHPWLGWLGALTICCLQHNCVFSNYWISANTFCIVLIILTKLTKTKHGVVCCNTAAHVCVNVTSSLILLNLSSSDPGESSVWEILSVSILLPSWGTKSSRRGVCGTKHRGGELREYTGFWKLKNVLITSHHKYVQLSSSNYTLGVVMTLIPDANTRV